MSRRNQSGWPTHRGKARNKRSKRQRTIRRLSRGDGDQPRTDLGGWGE